jgi:hypothetical protein
MLKQTETVEHLKIYFYKLILGFQTKITSRILNFKKTSKSLYSSGFKPVKGGISKIIFC